MAEEESQSKSTKKTTKDDWRKELNNKIYSIWNEHVWPSPIMTIGTLRPLHHWAMKNKSKIEEGEKVLEVGAGYPSYKAYSSKVGKDGLFISLDINPNIQSRSKSIAYWIDKLLKQEEAENSESIVTGDATSLPFPDDTFDALLAGNFTGDDIYIKEAYRVLKPGGRFITSTIETLSIPTESRKGVIKCKEVGFEKVKITPGPPAHVIPGFMWDWFVEAKKPLESSKLQNP